MRNIKPHIGQRWSWNEASNGEKLMVEVVRITSTGGFDGKIVRGANGLKIGAIVNICYGLDIWELLPNQDNPSI